ncbi:MAG: alpha/beta fold hydrolase [Pseudomonadota bacterium]
MTQSLLMIHGVGSGGDAWDRMRPLFEGAGFECHSPTLFPELRVVDSPDAALGQLSLNDYFEAMSEKAATLAEGGKKPAVIGHSMGGLIAQKLAEQGLVSAAIFLTPAAPAGINVVDLRPLRTFWNVVTKGRRKLPGISVKIGRSGFGWGVLNAVAKDRHDEIYAHARYDSGRVYADLLQPPPIEEGRVRIPTLTIGAKRDRTTVIKAVRKIGQKYAAAALKGDYLEYPDNAHWIVDEPGTDIVASDIITWLQRKLPERPVDPVKVVFPAS